MFLPDIFLLHPFLRKGVGISLLKEFLKKNKKETERNFFLKECYEIWTDNLNDARSLFEF